MLNFFSKKIGGNHMIAVIIVVAVVLPNVMYAAETNTIPTRRISMIAFEGAVLLDIVGPLSVFSAANFIISTARHTDQKAYEIEILSEKKGQIHSLSGMVILADDSFLNTSHKIDTLMIPGGPGREKASKNERLIKYLQEMNGKVRRLASICGGATVLAEAGLLKDKKATTHWSDIAMLTKNFPDIDVKSDVDFVGDGHIYTSGGVLNGVQLALAFVEQDHGRGTALKVAKLIEMKYEH